MWTETQDAVLRELHGAGKSAAEIAAIIGGMTRNAVLGRAHRLKLPTHRAAPSKAQAKRQAKKRRNSPERFEQGKKAKRPVFNIRRPAEDILPPTVVPEPPPPPVPMANIGIMDLTSGMCRWPLGDGPYRFCGHRKWGDKVYCEYHSRIAYRPPERREQRKNERFAARTP